MSDQNALTYVQILLAVLLFALGIPALIIEPAVEYRIRHVLHRHLPFRVVTMLLVCTVIILAALLLMPELRDALAATGSCSTCRGTIHEIGSVVSRRVIDTVARGAVAAIILTFALIWVKTSRDDVPAALIARIARRVRQVYNRRGYYRDDDLRDLVLVGSLSSPGHEKQFALRAISRVRRAVQESANYGGAELGAIIHGLLDMVRGPERRGDEGNFGYALEELRDVWRLLQARGLKGESDSLAVVEVACYLGELAVLQRYDSAAFVAVGVADDVPELAFRVGRAALAAGRFTVAVMCLTRLAGFAERGGTVSLEFIALLALFRDKGESACKFIKPSIELASPEDISRAAAAFYRRGDFATADAIAALERRARDDAESDGAV